MAKDTVLKIHFNGHNPVTITHIHTKFDSETKTNIPESEIPSNFTSAKIQDVGGLPFQKHKNRYNSNAL